MTTFEQYDMQETGKKLRLSLSIFEKKKAINIT
jgi:hypothetical protein